MTTTLNGYLPLAIDPADQAIRSLLAAETTAVWTFWLAIGTFGLLVGAIAAAFFALLTWLSTKGQLAAATTQLDMAKAASHQEEADNVSAWLAFDGTAMDIYVRNGNAGPVYDVNCLVEAKPDAKTPTPSAEIHRWVCMAVAPAQSTGANDKQVTLHSPGYVLGRVEGDKRYSLAQTEAPAPLESVDDWVAWDGKPGTMGLAVSLTFRDSAGAKWKRDWAGKLTELKEAS